MINDSVADEIKDLSNKHTISSFGFVKPNDIALKNTINSNDQEDKEDDELYKK